MACRAAKKIRVRVKVDSVRCDCPQGVDGAVDLTVSILDGESAEVLKEVSAPVPLEDGSVFFVLVEVPA